MASLSKKVQAAIAAGGGGAEGSLHDHSSDIMRSGMAVNDRGESDTVLYLTPQSILTSTTPTTVVVGIKCEECKRMVVEQDVWCGNSYILLLLEVRLVAVEVRIGDVDDDGKADTTTVDAQKKGVGSISRVTLV